MKKLKQSICLLLTFFILFSCALFDAGALNTEYKTWKQSDSRWGGITFGSMGDTISSSGCAITSIAILMVHSGAVSDDPAAFNPGILCNFLKSPEVNGFTGQGWIYWAAVDKYTGNFSYKTAVDLSGSVASKTAVIKDYINQGNVVVAMVRNGGHYVAVDKVENDTVYIFDPASASYTTLFQYDPSGVTKLRIYKGPTNGVVQPDPPAPEIVDCPTIHKKSDNGFYTGDYVVTSETGLNIRTGPGTDYSKLSFGVPYNQKVAVTDVNTNWGYIKYSGSEGWICLDYARRTSPVITGINVIPPSKTSYAPSENLSLDGMKVFAQYDDGSKIQFTGYSLSQNALSIGQNKITVTYGGFSTSFDVTVSGEITLGDANTDYAINLTDALLTLQYALNKIPAGLIDLGYADVNGDNAIDSIDALLILQYTVNKITRFPADGPNISLLSNQ